MLSSNESRACAVCGRSFEVPRGYPPAAGWQCARCLSALPACPPQFNRLTRSDGVTVCDAPVIGGRCEGCGAWVQ
jgi:hypothetical protein